MILMAACLICIPLWIIADMLRHIANELKKANEK